MPSASVFVSNLSLNSTGTFTKPSPMLTVDEYKKDKPGVSWLLVMSAVAVIISGAVPVGYNIGVLNAPQAILQTFCNETIYTKYDLVLTETQVNLLWSVVVSTFLIGGMVGSLCAGSLCNKFGRKGSIMLVNWLGLIGAVLFTSCQAAGSVEMLVLARLLVGLHGGFATSAVPTYLTEIAPASIRGPVGVLLPIGMGFGLVLSLVLGLEGILGNDWGWSYLLGLFAFPIAIGTILLAFCPESPKYLFIVKGRTDSALKQLCRLRNRPITDIEEDVLEMKNEVKQNLKSPSWSFIKVITCRSIRVPLVLLCILHASNQLSGINAVFYYSTGIFRSAGMSTQESQYAGIGAGMANFFTAATAAVLVSKFGRKKLFLTSTVLTTLCLAGMTCSFLFMNTALYVPYIAIALLLLYVLVFGIGIGPIPFFIGTELFQPGPRPTAMGIGCTVNWFFNFLVGATFPTVQGILGDYSFSIFIGFLVIIGFVLYFYLPETKDVDINQLMAYFDNVNHETPAINSVENAHIIQSAAESSSV